MLKLRTLLLSKYLYIFCLIIVGIYSFIYINIPRNSKYNLKDTKFIGVISSISYKSDKISLTIKSKEKLDGIYYLKDKPYIKLELGMKVKLIGELIKPSNNTVPNTFNYIKYLYRNHKFYMLNINSIEVISNNHNIFYSIKNMINNKIDKLTLSKGYIKAFVLGGYNGLDDDALISYRNNGISHLLAVSGMNISLIATFVLFILKKIGIYENKRYFITILFILLFMFLTSFTGSVMRASIFFILLSINKIYYFNISTLNIMVLTLIVILFINPFIIYDVGFLFSFVISFYLIWFNKLLENKSYFKSLIMIGIISFLSSFPITIYNFYQVNILSIIYNLFFVPFVSIIIFPLAIIALFLTFLDPIFYFLVNIMENLSIFLNNINFGKIILMKPNFIVIIIYYVVITYFLKSLEKKKYFPIIYFFLIVLIHYNFNYIISKDSLMMIDVGQGDSFLFSVDNKYILIDTGGKMFGQSKIAENILLPYLKSKGIKKLEYLILTHGDYDHLGEANKLINSMDINKVLFNKNEYNDNELKVIANLKKKKISYSSSFTNITYNNLRIKSLNTNLIDENDSSIILLINYKGISMLLMGDSSIKSEKYILNEYKLKDVHILKVGHHGSKTSTSEEFLKKVNPDISLISVGLNNKFKHPSEIVINRLKNINTKIYLTSTDGSVIIDLNNLDNIISFPRER
ncbi:MAG: DNA internalization-related competence protein ComEC/Rec2 [Bacilli bacterium]